MHKLTSILIPCALLVAFSAFGQNILNPDKVDPFKLSISGWVESTDNRDSTKKEVENTDFYVSPRVEYNSKIDAGMLTFYYAPAYRYRTKPGDQKNDSELYHFLGLSLERKDGRNHYRVNENFNYTDDPSIDKYGTLYRRDSSFIYNDLNAVMTHYFDRKTYSTLSANYFLKRYDDSWVARQSDEDRFGFNATVLRQSYENTAFVGSLGYTDYGYKKISGIDRGFGSVVAAAGLDSDISHDSRLSLRVGAQSVFYKDSSIDSEFSPYADLSCTYARVASTRFTGRVVYQIRESDAFPFASQTALDIDFGVEHDYTASITVGASGTYHVGDYDRDNASSFAGAQDFAKKTKGTEETIITRAFAKYNFNNLTYIRLAQQHEHVESDVRETFSRNSTTLAVSRQF